MSRVSHTTTTAQCGVQNAPLQSRDTNVPIKKACQTALKMTEKDGLLLDVSDFNTKDSTSASINQVLGDDELQHNKHALFETVSTATHVSDFNGMLNLIPLDKLKQFFNEHIDGLESTSTKNFFLLSASINRVFPDDLLQHILSFEHVYRTKSVCKIWRKLSNKNERIMLLNLCDEAHKMSPLQFDNQTNQTWIVHPARKKLNATERELGYQGPESCILDAVGRCKSGDRILVHDEFYILHHLEIHGEKSYTNVGNLEIIGIGPNVTVYNEYTEDEYNEDEEASPLFDIGWDGEVFFMNLTLDCSDVPKSTELARICIGAGSSFSAHKCNFAFASIGIEVFREARLKVTNCEFDGATTAIHISRLAADVTVNGSTFRHCGLEPDDECSLANGEHSCIAIDSWTQEVLVSLNCDRNTFQDNLCYPIAETACYDSDTGTVKPRLNLKPSLTNNWLKGYTVMRPKHGRKGF